MPGGHWKLIRKKRCLKKARLKPRKSSYLVPYNADMIWQEGRCGSGAGTTSDRVISGKAATRMMTSSNGNIFRVTGPLCGEFTGPGKFPAQKPVTRSFDVFFDLRLNKRLSKQSWGWWFETLSRPLWHQCNGMSFYIRVYRRSARRGFSKANDFWTNSHIIITL